MSKYHDAELDEYSRDPEDVAAVVLRRELAALTEDDEPPPVPKPKAKPSTPAKRAANGKELPPPPKGHREIALEDADKPPEDLVERERWAIKRARERAAQMMREG
jgi:hypothetical protein